jgi:tryptophanyl-tRNA synthetase|tara:strand:- start:189 stop:389 length:201 start_codon:yes stop_codon:yes gene_type:complete
MDKTEVANKVWKAFFQDGRKVSANEGNTESDICRVCGNDKSKARRNKKGQTVCEATEEHCKENKEL